MQNLVMCELQRAWSGDTDNRIYDWGCDIKTGQPLKDICNWSRVDCDAKKRVIHINLQSTKLSGTIPSAIGQIISLSYLALNMNKLTGLIPTELGLLTNLMELGLGKNMFNGTLPSELGDLININLELDVSENSLHGTVPSELGNLINVGSMKLHHNSFEGSLPDTFCKLKQLTHLDVDTSSLTCYPQCIIDAPLPPLIKLKEKTLNATIDVCTNSSQIPTISPSMAPSGAPTAPPTVISSSMMPTVTTDVPTTASMSEPTQQPVDDSGADNTDTEPTAEPIFDSSPTLEPSDTTFIEGAYANSHVYFDY
jgi:hypothetical protein